MKGFKAFDKDLKCRDTQFEVGKTYELKHNPALCKTGFHFCENAFDVYNYYPKAGATRICEVEALGEVVKEGDKSATNKIKIIKELTDVEKIDLWIKINNSGNYNSGYYNSGNYNSGYYNSGNYNSGNYNSGYYNSGNSNSGNSNSGNYNSGNYNSGYSNSGYSNSGNYNSGYFNSNDSTVRLFNKDTKLKHTPELRNRMYSLNIKPILQWISSKEMTGQEKNDNPSNKTTGGFLRKTNRNDYTKLTADDKKFILSLEGYDDEVFKQITGVSLKEEETIEVIINGKAKQMSKKQAIDLGLIDEKE